MTTELESKPWAGKIFVDGEFRDAEGAAFPVMDKGRGEELTECGRRLAFRLGGPVAPPAPPSASGRTSRTTSGRASCGGSPSRSRNAVMRSPS